MEKEMTKTVQKYFIPFTIQNRAWLSSNIILTPFLMYSSPRIINTKFLNDHVLHNILHTKTSQRTKINIIQLKLSNFSKIKIHLEHTSND